MLGRFHAAFESKSVEIVVVVVDARILSDYREGIMIAGYIFSSSSLNIMHQ